MKMLAKLKAKFLLEVRSYEKKKLMYLDDDFMSKGRMGNLWTFL